MSIEIRAAAEADIPALVRLRLAYFAEEFGQIEAETEKKIIASLPRYFAAHLGKDCFCWVAGETGDIEPHACVILCIHEKPANPSFPNGRDSVVLGVYTEPEYRGKGCATRLMQALLEAADNELHLDRVTLSASEMGRPIYEKLGFTPQVSHFTEMCRQCRPPFC